MKTIWKDIKGYIGLYQVSNMGHIKSLNYNHTGIAKQLHWKYHKNGYATVMLCKNGEKKNKSVHVLVAQAFIENHENLPCVNHIDGDKLNNSVENLERVTYQQNTRHAIKNGLRTDSNMRGKTGALNPSSKKVIQAKRDGTVVQIWSCISDAARDVGCSPCTIINCIKGRLKSCKGYVWRYAES